MFGAIRKKIAIGYLWNLLAKWLNRSIGLISTLCLVRILDPEDFGIVALASIVMAFFVMLSNAGTDKYLIRVKECTNEMLNSAWSLNITLKFVCSLVLALMAKKLSIYMNEPVLENVLLVCCLIPVISAFKNVGMVLFERELDYKPITRLSVGVKVAVVPITLIGAILIQSYWALIIGLLASEILTVLGSYRIHPYRPKWSMTLWKDQWSFSKWHLLSTSSGYIRSRIDALLLGRYLTSADVGVYRVSQEFAWLPFTEVISPATSSMYAGITQVREHHEELKGSILNYLAFAYLLVVPSAFGIFALSDLFTEVVLGEKWLEAAPIIGLLSLLMLSMPLNISLQSVLTNLSKIKYLVLLDVVMISAIVGLIIGLSKSNNFDLLSYTQYRVALVVLFMLMLCVAYKLLINLSPIRIMAVILLPTIPSIVMVNVIASLKPQLHYSEAINLIILVIAGGISFVPVMAVLIGVTKNWLVEYALIFDVLKKLKASTQKG